ncbi:helix-turn-helix domain-containing protein [Pseudomonas sp. GD03842]|uniref:helix-turn-helix domain-containing protein n=1 Tax=unclassified Pseudomonas TaxID=196821 RepID=UPI000D367253|nr:MULTISPECIES: helix-turn-helix transcriptional regulator [unclassified Pseudomonas]MDH0744813.1 helix-turn-helix domain-containing protein [Pseudomonas sp. GD03842]RAU45451.1 XRE family transcriptional regulator [Pseudomonas sp. RIT 409]RAU53164.1 XRE family transcriptional regulator [Pseudomonas sp. RIT 412]
MNIGRRLKEERKRLGLSQQEFGAVGGVEANAQGKYESGERIPRADYLADLEKRGVDILYVLSGKRTPLAIDALSEAERAIITHYRALGEKDRYAISQLADSLSECAPEHSTA